MVDYTRAIDILANNHSQLADSTDATSHLILDGNTRQITAGSTFHSLIGTTDDINTNIITFRVPAQIEGHRVLDCQHKVVKWHNLISGEKGISGLYSEAGEDSSTTLDPNTGEEIITKSEVLLLEWAVPNEALTTAGTVKISLCFISITLSCQNMRRDNGWCLIFWKASV
jgi:hypothetical protein